MLHTESVDGDETLEGNEVDTEENDTKLVLPLARIDKSEDDVGERPQKKRILHRVAISETNDQRAKFAFGGQFPQSLGWRMYVLAARMKARLTRIEEEHNIECNEAVSQGQITLAEWAEIEAKIADMKEDGTTAEGLRSGDLRQFQWKI